MKIELYPAIPTPETSMSLEAFADKHGLVMQIRERDHTWRHTTGRYFASFKDCETKEHASTCILRGTYGNGSTPELAMADYAKELSGLILVVRACHPDRREIPVPTLAI